MFHSLQSKGSADRPNCENSGDSSATLAYLDEDASLSFVENSRAALSSKDLSKRTQKRRTELNFAEDGTNGKSKYDGKYKKRRRTAEQGAIQFHENVLAPSQELSSDLHKFKFRSKIWTTEMDNALSSTAVEFNKDWPQVAAKLNSMFQGKLSNSQCQKRWTQYISPEIQERKNGPWTADEIHSLHILVEQNTREVHGNGVISWDVVSKALNRRYFDCQNKWNTISKSNLKVGRFSPEEDDTIRRAVAEWTANGVRQGLWIFLQKSLGRRNDVIRKRWQTVLSKRDVPVATFEDLQCHISTNKVEQDESA